MTIGTKTAGTKLYHRHMRAPSGSSRRATKGACQLFSGTPPLHTHTHTKENSKLHPVMHCDRAVTAARMCPQRDHSPTTKKESAQLLPLPVHAGSARPPAHLVPALPRTLCGPCRSCGECSPAVCAATPAERGRDSAPGPCGMHVQWQPRHRTCPAPVFVQRGGVNEGGGGVHGHRACLWVPLKLNGKQRGVMA
jgi:hypothetical protein